MNIEQVLSKKRYGDNITVAKILGTTHFNVAQILKRPKSKKHKKVIEALTVVVESREAVEKSNIL